MSRRRRSRSPDYEISATKHSFVTALGKDNEVGIVKLSVKDLRMNRSGMKGHLDMHIELREARISDGHDVLEMLHEIGPGENGFGNQGHDLSFEEFPEFLREQVDMSAGIGIDRARFVPQTRYWLYVDGRPVGLGKFRPGLNDYLRKHGEHMGYCIRPSERGKGYGHIILKELLKRAYEMGVTDVLLTCSESNLASKKIIEVAGGELDSSYEGKCLYWIRNVASRLS